MNGQPVAYQKLEFAIHSEPSEQRKAGLISKLTRIWSQFVESIIAVDELKIYSLRSKSGSAYWAIHDPLLGYRIFFDSEADVREWLDRRYYK
jgi:hypothetical protein